MLLVEETFVERGWGWRRVESANIIVIPSAIQHVRIKHVGTTERLGRFTNIVDGVVYSQVLRVADFSCVAAGDDLVFAGAGALEGVGHVLPLGLVDGLDAVGVIVGHGWVGGPLDESIDAAVDDE